MENLLLVFCPCHITVFPIFFLASSSPCFAVCLCKENEDKNAWLPIHNHDLGAPTAFDHAILWLDSCIRAVLWIEHVPSAELNRGFPVLFATPPPPPNVYVSYFLVYAEYKNIAFVLVFWEEEDENLRAVVPRHLRVKPPQH